MLESRYAYYYAHTLDIGALKDSRKSVPFLGGNQKIQKLIKKLKKLLKN
jgi:hypothetical protein